MSGWLRLGLILLGGVAALLGGFVLPDKGQLEPLYARWGFSAIFLSFVLWLLAMWRLGPPSREGLRTMVSRNWAPLLLSVVLLGAAFCVAPPKFRIQYDESNLAGMAFSMQLRHEIWVPLCGYYKAGNYEDIEHNFDKRPLAFPFLVHALHALTGYRAANSFVLNFILGTGTLFLLFVLLRRWTSPLAAYGGMLVLAAYPLFVLWSSSGGFEIANLFWLLLSVLFLDDLARGRDANHALAFVATLVLLAQSRYESALFLPAGLVMAAMLLRRGEWKRLPWWMGLLPLVLIPLAWQQVLFLDPKYHQLEHAGPMFSLDFLAHHLGRAWLAFTTDHERHMTLPGGLLLALSGFTLMLLDAVQGKRLGQARPWALITYLAAGYGLISGLQFSYHMGDLTQNITARLGIIYLPLVAVGAGFLFDVARQYWQRAGVVAVGLAFCLLLWAWPVAGNQQALNTLVTTRYYEMLLDFLEKRDLGRNILVIAERGHPLILRGYGAVTFSMANKSSQRVRAMMESRFFQTVLTAQVLELESGRPSPEYLLNPDYELEPLYEEQIHREGFMRISRVLPRSARHTPVE